MNILTFSKSAQFRLQSPSCQNDCYTLAGEEDLLLDLLRKLLWKYQIIGCFTIGPLKIQLWLKSFLLAAFLLSKRTSYLSCEKEKSKSLYDLRLFLQEFTILNSSKNVFKSNFIERKLLRVFRICLLNTVHHHRVQYVESTET